MLLRDICTQNSISVIKGVHADWNDLIVDDEVLNLFMKQVLLES